MRLVPRILVYMTCEIRASEVESAGCNLAGEMVIDSSDEALKNLSDSNMISCEDPIIPAMHFRVIYLVQNSDSHLHAAEYTPNPPSTTYTQTPDSPYP
jgi:hypothetical protein